MEGGWEWDGKGESKNQNNQSVLIILILWIFWICWNMGWGTRLMVIDSGNHDKIEYWIKMILSLKTINVIL